ncbi:hypothetical protein niasHT_035529 [Heterodera trifolii]|uniref:Uncharacterized protein n=1 Tax=Heterodera trifolii TaxID=157864 RepID=A0ABD2IC12_9BILA
MPRAKGMKKWCQKRSAFMAGRAIELLLIGESHGDEGDVEEATVNARELLRKSRWKAPRGNKKALDRAIKKIIDESTEEAKVFLQENWTCFEKFAIVLHERKTINADEAEEILGYYL